MIFSSDAENSVSSLQVTGYNMLHASMLALFF